MDVERLIERLAVIADTSFLDHAAADDLREAAAALAKLQAERDEAREALRPVNGDDGGWLFVKSLFVPRTVTRLSVPGAGPDGMHRIEVELSDGSSVMVTGVNHQAAWQSLADAAAAGRALGGGG